MSHEIRTPMNAIIGYASILMSQPTQLTDDQQEALTIITNSGEALLTLINDILDLSKIESGKLELETAPLNLRETLEACVDVLSDSAADKKLALTLHVDTLVPTVVVSDQTRLRQILINVIGNAIKFSFAGGHVSVRVTALAVSPRAIYSKSHRSILASQSLSGEQAALEQQASNHHDDAHEHKVSEAEAAPPPGSSTTSEWDGTELCISIADTGIGVAPEQAHLLFQSFSQLQNGVREQYGGTGLGLAISKRLAQLLGGDLRCVSSGVGCGSTFTFTVKSVATPEQNVPPDVMHARGLQRRAHRLTDSPQTRASIVTSLLSARCLVLHQSSIVGQQVVDLCTAWGVAAVYQQDVRQALQQVAVSAALSSPTATQQHAETAVVMAMQELQASGYKQADDSMQSPNSDVTDSSHIDLVIMPRQFGDMFDGLAVARQMQAMHRAVSSNPTSNVMVLMLTSLSRNERDTAALADGLVTAYLSQPVKPAQLFAAMQQTVAAIRKQRQTATSNRKPLLRDQLLRSQLNSNGVTPSTVARTLARTPADQLPTETPRTTHRTLQQSLKTITSVSVSPNRPVRELHTARAVSAPDIGSSHPLRILIVEDQSVNQRLLRQLLIRLGYAAECIEIVNNGLLAVRQITGLQVLLPTSESVQEAVAASTEVIHSHFDVVLMDLQMPVCDGLTSTQLIRQAPLVVQPFIIACTANAMQGDAQRCYDAGMDHYISKPVRLNQLADALQRAARKQ